MHQRNRKKTQSLPCSNLEMMAVERDIGPLDPNEVTLEHFPL